MHAHLARLLLICLLCTAMAASAADWLYKRDVTGPFPQTYRAVHEALENSDFFVVKELNIGANLQRLSYRWGDDYNRNRFAEVRSLIVCNPSFANQVLNVDPEMMALCPLNITLLHKENNTTLLYERVGAAAAGRPGEEVLREVDNIIISALEEASP